MTTPATVVSFELTLADDIASFGAHEFTRLVARLRVLTDCLEPGCRLSLSLTPSSVRLTAVLTIPYLSGPFGSSANPEGMAVAATASSLVALPLTNLSAALGHTALSTANVTAVGAYVPIAVASSSICATIRTRRLRRRLRHRRRRRGRHRPCCRHPHPTVVGGSSCMLPGYCGAPLLVVCVLWARLRRDAEQGRR